MGIKHIIMPDLGESVTEATVTEWLIQPGDQVNKYDPLLEAQSDKVVTEIPSEFDGKIIEILIEAGEIVPIGTKLLKIEVEGAETDDEETIEVEVTETSVAKEDLQAAFEPELAEETPALKQVKQRQFKSMLLWMKPIKQIVRKHVIHPLLCVLHKNVRLT